jgi:hypothetical protein
MNVKSIWQLVLLVCAAAIFPSAAFAQGEGPRVYFPTPNGMNQVTVFYMGVDGNQTVDGDIIVPEADIAVDTVLVQFTAVREIFGQPGAFLLFVPVGEVRGNLRLAGGGGFEAKTSGFGDVLVGMAVGLAGTPALTREEYFAYKPDYQVGVLGRVTIPTGDYDSNRTLNYGGNRWITEIGLPSSIFIGEGLLDPQLMTIEFNPVLTMFGNNNDPTSGDKLEQDPLFSADLHLTRNFSPAIWGSLDAQYSLGGETKIDGIDQDNSQESLSLGATIGLNLSASLSTQVSVGKSVANNNDGAEGDFVRVKFGVLF